MEARCGGSLCSLVSLHYTGYANRLDALTSLDPDRSQTPPNIHKVSSTTCRDIRSFRARAYVCVSRSLVLYSRNDAISGVCASAVWFDRSRAVKLK